MERRGCPRRRMLVWALGTICFVGAQGAPARAEDTTEVAKRQLAVALAGWDDAEREQRLDVSLRSQRLAAGGWDHAFPGLDVPASPDLLPPPSEPMRLEGWVRGGEAALLHAAPAPLLAWYRGPGGTWMRAVDPGEPQVRYRVRVASGQEIALRPIGVGWAHGQAPDFPTLELDLGAALDLGALRAWLLEARSLRRWERASGGTQIRAMARPTEGQGTAAWGAVGSLELTLELDTQDRLTSLKLEVDRPGGGSMRLPGRLNEPRFDRGPLDRWRLPFPRAPLSDPNDVLQSGKWVRVGVLGPGNPPGNQPPLDVRILPSMHPWAVYERLTLEITPRQAPTSRLLTMFLARRRG